MEDETEESVSNWFEGKLDSSPKDLSERLRAVLESVNYRVCSNDPGAAAMEFVDGCTVNNNSTNDELISIMFFYITGR